MPVYKKIPFKLTQAGFTLIELLVVIAIIGILSLFAAPSVSQMLEDTNQLDENTELKITNAAAKQFEAEYGRTAQSAEELREAKLVMLNQSRYTYNFDQTTGKFTSVDDAREKSEKVK